jgi:hypothetical protein
VRRRCLVASSLPATTHAGTRDRCHRTVLCGSRLITAASLVPLRASVMLPGFAKVDKHQPAAKQVEILDTPCLHAWPLDRYIAHSTQRLLCWAVASPRPLQSESGAELLSALVPGERPGYAGATQQLRSSYPPPPHLNEWGSADPPGDSRRGPGVWRPRTDALVVHRGASNVACVEKTCAPVIATFPTVMLACPPVAAASAHTALGHV